MLVAITTANWSKSGALMVPLISPRPFHMHQLPTCCKNLLPLQADLLGTLDGCVAVSNNPPMPKSRHRGLEGGHLHKNSSQMRPPPQSTPLSPSHPGGYVDPHSAEDPNSPLRFLSLPQHAFNMPANVAHDKEDEIVELGDAPGPGLRRSTGRAIVSHPLRVGILSCMLMLAS
jgi:hypothetical protein